MVEIVSLFAREYCQKNLDALNVGFFTRPYGDRTVPSILSISLRSQITTYLARVKANPADPNLLLGLDIIPIHARFLLDDDVEVTTDQCQLSYN